MGPGWACLTVRCPAQMVRLHRASVSGPAEDASVNEYFERDESYETVRDVGLVAAEQGLAGSASPPRFSRSPRPPAAVVPGPSRSGAERGGHRSRGALRAGGPGRILQRRVRDQGAGRRRHPGHVHREHGLLPLSGWLHGAAPACPCPSPAATTSPVPAPRHRRSRSTPPCQPSS